MSVQAVLPKSSVEAIVERIFALRQISRADQNLLMSALLHKEKINETDRQQIDRVFEALQRGFIRVVN